MNPYVIIGLIAALAASHASVFWLGTSYEDGQHAKQEVVIKDAVAAATAGNQEFADGVGLRVETALGKIRITNTTIQQEIRHEVETKLVDNPDCRIPVSVVRLLNQSRDFRQDGSSIAEPAARVPGAGEVQRGATAEGR